MSSGSVASAQAIAKHVEGVSQALAELRESLAQVEAFARTIEGVMGGAGRATPAARGTAAAAEEAPKKGRRRGRRGGKLYPTAAFVVAQLAKHPKGLRPREIAEMLQKEAPGVHKSAQASVNTALSRLREQKKVRNDDGVWSVGKRG